MSISKIARELNVSKSTVSLVINGKAQQSRISKDLEKRILDYVKEIGFKPNALAKSLATGKSRTIGLIVENIGDSFFGPIALLIEEKLRDHGYHVFYGSTSGKEENAKQILNSMTEKKVEGIILSPTLNLEKEINKVLAAKIPLVIFDRKANLENINYIGTDNYASSRLAVRHLINRGHNKIAMITSDSSQSQMTERVEAYKAEMIGQKLVSSILQVPFDMSAEARIRFICKFLDINDVEALYFATNYLCIAGIKAVQLLAKSKQYALLSFDDHEVYEILKPSITCIRQPISDISNRIVENLLTQISNELSIAEEHIIASSLIVRDSTIR